MLRLLIAALTALVLSASAFAQATIIRIDDDSPAALANQDGLSWATAYENLRDAVDAAIVAGGDYQFWLAEGDYTAVPSGGTGVATDWITFRPGWELFGGFIGNEGALASRSGNPRLTKIDGALNATLDAFYIFRITGAQANQFTRLDGFNFHGGQSYHLDVRPSNPEDVSLLISDVHFRDLGQTFGISSIRMGTTTAPAKVWALRDCVFRDNLNCQSLIQVAPVDTTIADTEGTVAGCVFRDNSFERGAIYFSGWRSPGAATSGDDVLLVQNCLFYDNQRVPSSFLGSVIYLQEWNGPVAEQSGNNKMVVDHCTFSQNNGMSAMVAHDFQGSTVPTYANSVEMYSSIIYGNTNSGFSMYRRGQMPGVPSILTYSCDDEGVSANDVTVSNVTSVDPLFINPGANNFRLRSTSPVCDAATDTVLRQVPFALGDRADQDQDGDRTDAVSVDLKGNAREVDNPFVTDTGQDLSVTGKISDMGCYEVQADAPPSGL